MFFAGVSLLRIASTADRTPLATAIFVNICNFSLNTSVILFAMPTGASF
jgi:hypothetical protein